MQLGLWAFSELGGGGELEERGRKGALSYDRQEPGPAHNPAGDRGRSGCGRSGQLSFISAVAARSPDVQ